MAREFISPPNEIAELVADPAKMAESGVALFQLTPTLVDPLFQLPAPFVQVPLPEVMVPSAARVVSQVRAAAEADELAMCAIKKTEQVSENADDTRVVKRLLRVVFIVDFFCYLEAGSGWVVDGWNFDLSILGLVRSRGRSGWAEQRVRTSRSPRQRIYQNRAAA